MLPYIFLPSMAMGLCFIFHLPKLHETYSGEYRDLPEPIKLPGCVPVHGRDFPDALQDRKSESYKWSIHQFKRFNMAHGMLGSSPKLQNPVVNCRPGPQSPSQILNSVLDSLLDVRKPQPYVCPVPDAMPRVLRVSILAEIAAFRNLLPWIYCLGCSIQLSLKVSLNRKSVLITQLVFLKWKGTLPKKRNAQTEGRAESKEKIHIHSSLPPMERYTVYL